MNLREIAKQAVVLDGQLTLWMMPYLTLRNDIVVSAFARIVPRDDWGNIHQVFIICEGALVDAEISGESAEARGFAAYWQERGSDIGANWDLFTMAVGGKAYGAVLEAYLDTRDTAFDAAEPMNADAEGEPDPQLNGG